MEATNIPFVKSLEIRQDDKVLSLQYKEDILNHIETIHAGAQFTLAETQSGVFLQNLFPELQGRVIPLLRDSKIKYKKPAQSKIIAKASVDEDVVVKFKKQFEKRGRGSIEVFVDIYDANDVLVCEASFTWFVSVVI